MIQSGTYLRVIDNTYVKDISCIQVKKYGSSKHPVGKQGDVFVGSVKSLRKVKASITRSQKHLINKGKKKRWQRGDLLRALIVRTRKNMDRSKGLGRNSKNQTGIRLSFPEGNAAILLGTQKDPLGSRIKGAISPAVRSGGYNKILSIGGRSV